MKAEVFETADEVLEALGARLKARRIQLQLDQAETAARAGVGERALRQLEQGQGSTLQTFVRVLRALGAMEQIDAFLPKPSVSPMAMLSMGKPRKRVGKPHRAPKATQ